MTAEDPDLQPVYLSDDAIKRAVKQGLVERGVCPAEAHLRSYAAVGQVEVPKSDGSTELVTRLMAPPGPDGAAAMRAVLSAMGDELDPPDVPGQRPPC